MDRKRLMWIEKGPYGWKKVHMEGKCSYGWEKVHMDGKKSPYGPFSIHIDIYLSTDFQ